MPVLGRLPGDERLVFDCLTGAAVTAEVVSAASGLPSSRALAALMRLELRGLVRAVGGRYQRTVAATGAR
jgi:predicted Rossmann fold nucleotide-binding protein DprA/Smf involved in DNA uptake